MWITSTYLSKSLRISCYLKVNLILYSASALHNLFEQFLSLFIIKFCLVKKGAAGSRAMLQGEKKLELIYRCFLNSKS